MTRAAVKAVFGISGVIVISRVLGMLREIIIADNFGTSPEYDLYLIAVMIPALAYAVLNFAYYYLLVPLLTRQLQSAGAEGKPALTSSSWSVFNSTMAVALVVAGIIVITAPIVMRIWGGGYGAEEYSRIIWLTRVVAVSVVLGASEAFLRALLNSIRLFVYPAGGFIIFNCFSIVAIVLGAPKFGVGALALAFVGGLLAQNLYLFTRLFVAGWFRGYRPVLGAQEFSSFWGMAGLLVAVELLGKSYFLIDRYFALPLGDGVVAALTYSHVLVLMPDSIVGFAIGSVLFPLFSDNRGNDDVQLGRLYLSGISAGFMAALPAALYVFVNASDIVRLIFMRGAFDSQSLLLTTTALKSHCPTIVALFVVSTSIRACYARGWGLPVLAAGIGLLAVKFASTWLFSKLFGYSGITLATSVTQLAFAASLMFIVKSKLRGVLSGGGSIILRIIFAAVLSIALVLVVQHLLGEWLSGTDLLSVVIRLVVSGSVLWGVYSGLVYLFGLSTLYRQIRL